jgi:Tol biopolymer transport system component
MGEITFKQIGFVILAVFALLALYLLQYALIMPLFSAFTPFNLSDLGSLEKDDLSIYSEEGYFSGPQFTSDGSHIIYLATVRPAGKTEGWEQDIWIMDRDGTNQTRLTRQGDMDRISVSPASDRIAYTHYDSGRISVFLTSAEGTSPARVPCPLQFTYFSSWSPDGEQMAVAGIDPSGWNGFWILPDGNQTPAWGQGTRSRLYVMDSNGGNPAFFGNVTMPDTYDHYVETSWSPDGERVAFPYDVEGATGIAVADLESGRVTRLTEDGGTFPRWSPEGGLIAWIQAGNVHVIRPDGSGERKISGDGTADALSWNPAGTRLAYSTDNMVGIIDPDGTNLTPLANIHPGPVSWSPEGRIITYSPGIGARIRIQTLSPGVVKMGEYMYKSLER